MNMLNSNVDSLLQSLREKNIHLKLNENNNLDVESPKGGLEKEVVDTIRNSREDIINYLRHVKTQEGMGKQIPKAPDASNYPLSSAQKRIWLSSNVRDVSAAYNIKSSFELNGSFDPQFFEQSIQRVIERHEILRTVFRKDEQGEIRQWILQPEELSFKLAYLDLSQSGNGRAQAEAIILEDSRKPFDLEKAPLFRVILIRLGEQQYLVYYVMHHIITDAWSMNLLARDILMAYENYQDGLPGNLPTLPLQYKDYAVWQQAQLESGSLDEHRQYWLHQFSGDLPVFDLRFNNMRPPVLSTNGYVLGAFIGEEVIAPFKKVCLRHSGSLFMGLIAALKTLFYRYSGQHDIILGTPAAGREHSDLHDQIGFYINTLALRTQFDGNDSFAQLFQKVRTTIMDAYAHQSFPFDRMVEELQLKRDPSRSILFDAFVNFENTAGAGRAQWAGSKDAFLEGDRSSVRDMGAAISKFDLIFNFNETGDAVFLAIEFNRDLYTRENIVSFIDHFKQLLSSIAADPDAAISALTYLSREEQQQIINKSKGPRVNYPQKSVVDMIRWQADNVGDQPALRYDEQVLTCRELDERSNQAAHYLRSAGIGRETLVPVCMHRSIDMVVAILGILKTGAAFVPIDPELPQERINYMLSDTDCKWVFTDQHCSHLLPRGTERELISFETTAEKIAAMPVTALQDTIAPDQLAYMIYTSGSTGLPKGVQIQHGSLSNYLNWALELYMPGENEGRMGLFTSLSFDLTITTLFGALAKGKLLHLFPQDMGVAEILTKYLDKDSGLDIIKLTPAHIRAVAALELKTISVKKMIVGGEQLHNLQVRMLQTLNNDIIVYNEYGPTEATVGCTVSVIKGELKGMVNIGRPVPNTELFILDNHQQLVPAGVVGELYIGGSQLARGYMGKKDLTAEKFIANALASDGRLYRTGDIGRWLPDGNIEFIGRVDDQVKIRGYRIEPGEVESSLLQHPYIRDAVVAVRKSPLGEYELVGFVIADPAFNANALRLYLKNKLPEYMIPNIYIQLNEFPLTVNAKVDRQQLIEQANSYVGAVEEQFELPANDVERQLVEIWKKVLMIHNDISVTANFFELGGHSIRAIKMLTQASQLFGISISVKSLFEEPTIRQLAAKILNAGWVKNNQAEKVSNTEYEKIKI